MRRVFYFKILWQQTRAPIGEVFWGPRLGFQPRLQTAVHLNLDRVEVLDAIAYVDSLVLDCCPQP